MTWAAYGPPWAAYGPRNPSADGFRWHDVSEDVKKPADVLAGQRPISAAHEVFTFGRELGGWAVIGGLPTG